ncbi:MAG: hypothetical protein COA78_29410 [Blastopirellula sp.]|nr:MAG: hypothetical protein COA78_29410 [Blastopirellula sp.]
MNLSRLQFAITIVGLAICLTSVNQVKAGILMSQADLELGSLNQANLLDSFDAVDSYCVKSDLINSDTTQGMGTPFTFSLAKQNHQPADDKQDDDPTKHHLSPLAKDQSMNGSASSTSSVASAQAVPSQLPQLCELTLLGNLPTETKLTLPSPLCLGLFRPPQILS